MVDSRYRTQIRLCTASFTYSTAIMSQLVFGTCYPQLFESQFVILGTIWVVLFSLESSVLHGTNYGPEFIVVRSFMGMNALFSLVAGEEVKPLFTSYQYELTIVLSAALIASLLALTTSVLASHTQAVPNE